jgi:hypothetical protein
VEHDSGNDPIYDEMLSFIDQYGWAVRHVGAGEEAAFSYTIGLTAMGHPEIIMEGLPFDVAQVFLNLMGAEVKAGTRFSAGSITKELTEPPAPIAFISVTDTTKLTAAKQVFGKVEALQAIWCDSTGRLPWEPGYRNPADAQPLLGPTPKGAEDAPKTPPAGSEGEGPWQKMTHEFDNEMIHRRPVWRDRADYILRGSEPDEDGTEQLWARKLDGTRFEICCIPFTLYELALGDIVEREEHRIGVRVVESSNRSVFRVWFGESTYPKDEIEQTVLHLGGLVEWSSAGLLAIDAANAGIAGAVFAYLERHHNDGHLLLETGKW